MKKHLARVQVKEQALTANLKQLKEQLKQK